MIYNGNYEKDLILLLENHIDSYCFIPLRIGKIRCTIDGDGWRLVRLYWLSSTFL